MTARVKQARGFVRFRELFQPARRLFRRYAPLRSASGCGPQLKSRRAGFQTILLLYHIF